MLFEQPDTFSHEPYQMKEQSKQRDEKVLIQHCISVLQRITPQIFNCKLQDMLQQLILGPNAFQSTIHPQNTSFSQNNSIYSPIEIESNNDLTLVVSAFCNRGYGFAALKNWLVAEGKALQISVKDYEELIKKAIAKVYCKLIEYLHQEREDHEENIHTEINEKQMELICKIAVDCRNSLRPISCRALLNSLKAIHSVDNYEGVTLEDALQLYKQFRLGINKASRDKKSETQHQRPIQLPIEMGNQTSFKWNRQLEKQLLSQYRKGLSFIAIGKRMRQLFPSEAQFLNSQTIKNKFTRMLKVALKKLQGEVEALKGHTQPILARLQENKQNLSQNSERANKIRGLLLNLYERDFNQSQFIQIVQEVNFFLAQQQQSQAHKVSQPLYHPRFRNGKREYGKYNRPYQPNQEKRKFRKQEEYAQRERDKMQRFSDHDPHSDNESVLSIA